jgi:hypothetical protein
MAVYIPQIIDNLLSTSKMDGLSANQGRVLKAEQGDLLDLVTIDKDTLVGAINELKATVDEIIAKIDEINGVSI